MGSYKYLSLILILDQYYALDIKNGQNVWRAHNQIFDKKWQKNDEKNTRDALMAAKKSTRISIFLRKESSKYQRECCGYLVKQKMII